MATPDENGNGQGETWQSFLDQLNGQLEETKQELNETTRLLEQSSGEVEKLTQRNATISAHLQQVQSQIETVPPSDIRVAYDAALEAQQRLVVMRGQIEKLQSERAQMQRRLELLQQVQASAGGAPPKTADIQPKASSVEVMIQAQESERQRLSRQMHDGPAQALSNFILQTEIALRLFEVDSDQARQELNELKSSASKTFQKVRDFIFDLRPMMLDDLGLVPTIRRYADNYAEKTGMEIQVTVTGSERRLPSYLEVVVFRAIQELMTSESLHTQASQLKVQLDIAEQDVRVSVEDNGRGFEPQTIPEEAELGVNAIRERVDMLGGAFEIDSAVGQGARFAFNIPARASAIPPK